MSLNQIAGLLLTLIIVGAVLYLVKLIPMDAWMRTVINVIAIIAVVLWIASMFGIVPFRLG